MIAIVPKPTDTKGDDSTSMVVAELKKSGISPVFLNLDEIDPFSADIDGWVIWVCGMRQDEHQFEVLDALSLNNKVINSPKAIVTCASKVKTSALLQKAGIQTPETFFCGSKRLADQFIARHGDVVFKPVYGFDGNGIRKVSSPGDLGVGPYYLQEYIKNDRDYRVFVIGGEAVGAIVRQSDTLAHNIHQGGVGKAIEVSDTMNEIAGAAADAVGVDYGGVDLLDDRGGYTVLEVNGTPNWHCMSAPIPRLLSEYIMMQDREYCR